MGVTGLWDIIRQTGRSQSLLSLTVTEGFEDNPSGRRALRVGIDVSLWYRHALGSKEGENPEIRALFFRTLHLLEKPMIPLFVFDGRERPRVKRGNKMGKCGSHKYTAKMKEMLDTFGIEWRMARGEAEAELAFLNQTGIIDAVMTDDVDALLFGAKMIIRNPTNKSRDEDESSKKTHLKVFRAEEIKNQVGLTKEGMILLALLSGGDYDTTGVRGIGVKVAHGLARCGFGERLIAAYDERGPQGIQAFLPQWRAEVNSQLHTNSKGFLPNRCPSVILPDDFPNIQVLVNYAHPICSATAGTRGGPLTDKGNPSIANLARFAEYNFGEWGFRSKIVDRFRDLVWHAGVIFVLRRAALEADEKERNKRSAAGRHDLAIRGPLEPLVADGVGTPATSVKKYLNPVQEDILASAFVNKGPQAGPANNANVKVLDEHPLIAKITGFRSHERTDRLPEYRIEVNPTQFVDLAHAGILDIRDDPGETRDLKKPRPEPHEILKLWVPASMMKQVHPRLVEEYQTGQMEKAAGGTAKKSRGKAAAHQSGDDDGEPASPTKKKAQPRGPNAPVTATQAGSSSSQAGSRQTGTSRPAPLIEIPVEAESSLPLRKCGFMFTYPNPDNPDFLLSDEEDEIAADADTTVEVRRVEATAVVSAARPANVQTQRQPRQSEPTDIGLETGGGDDDGDADVDEFGPQTYKDAWVDSVLFPKGKKRQTKTAAKPRKRGRKPQVGDAEEEEHQEHQAAAKRQKISQPPAIVQSSSSVAVARGNNRPVAPFPIAVEAPTNIREVRHRDGESPLAQVYPQASAMDADSQDELVVAGTGGSARKGKTVLGSGRPGRRVYVPPPTSSQDSQLGGDFLCDVDMVIDLT